MTDTTHTPGPWTSGGREHERYTASTYQAWIASSDIIVATLECARDDREAIESVRADARLIAAAPDLLAALREALRWLDAADRFRYPADHREGDSHQSARATARAVIRKATEGGS